MRSINAVLRGSEACRRVSWVSRLVRAVVMGDEGVVAEDAFESG